MYNMVNTDVICPNCGEGHMIREESRVIKSKYVITEFEVDKKDMCEQAQSICNRNCEHCAWQTERSE